jgi:putative membrane protein
MQKANIFSGRIVLAAAFAAVSVMAVGQTSMKSSSGTRGDQAGTSSAADKKFVREAAEGGMAEVELGKLATEKASSEQVKKFGQRMVDDHTKAGDELKGIASNKGIQVPEKLSAKDQMTKERLSKLSGEQFDKAYMNDMVKDHTQDVADFKRESTSGTDSDVKEYASKTLPTLQDHLRQAKEIAPASTASNK